MNSEKLSKRLETVARYIPPHFRLADIGSDHAYLPCYVVQQGIVPFAIAGEVVEGPYRSAKSQVDALQLTETISVRKGDGLEVIEKGEVDCIAIAGMGGSLIASILEKGKDKLKGIKRLILQPNISAISIREWLNQNGWVIIAEEILEEDEKIYEVLIAERRLELEKDDELDNQEKALLLGPLLLKEKSQVFIKKWKAEKENWLRIVQQLETAAETPENMEKKRELVRKINLVEEVLQ